MAVLRGKRAALVCPGPRTRTTVRCVPRNLPGPRHPRQDETRGHCSTLVGKRTPGSELGLHPNGLEAGELGLARGQTGSTAPWEVN